jgi:probable rRNA maturation factor
VKNLDVQVASEQPGLPSKALFARWLAPCLPPEKRHWDITIRLVDNSESQTLNRDYRDKDYPTNVLSFPSDLPADLNIPLLGDLVICAPVVAQEAEAQSKELLAHWAHMTVHGCLHLLGYDHETDAQAEVMESLERSILLGLGFADPYPDLSH